MGRIAQSSELRQMTGNMDRPSLKPRPASLLLSPISALWGNSETERRSRDSLAPSLAAPSA
jgi:hypothetical protein